MLIRLFVIGLAFLFFFFSSCGTNSGTTGLDSTFGVSGKVTIDFSSGQDECYSVALQSDGKIILAGRATVAGAYNFALARLSTDGSLDSTFGTNGKVTTAFGGEGSAQSVAIQSDGKILVAGSTTSGGTTSFAIARYSSTGSLDSTFHSTGTLTLPLGGTLDTAYAVALQSDGKILVGGSSKVSGTNRFAIVRLTSTGSLDTDFNSTGKVTTAIGSEDDQIRSLAVQSDGGIVAAGYSADSGKKRFALARYSTLGVPDTSFNGSGKVTSNFATRTSSSDQTAFGLLLSGSKVITAGVTNRSGLDQFALAQYTSGGALDSTFGSSGTVFTTFTESDNKTPAAAQARALVAGARTLWVVGYATLSSSVQFALARYDSTGNPDTFLGTNGIATVGFTHDLAEAYGAVVQTDDKLLVAGRAFNGADFDFALIRYNP